MPQPIYKQVFNRLTKLYIIALASVALLSLAGQLLVQASLNDLLEDAHIVNIAGRQRMLSQRITKTLLLLVREHITDKEKILLINDLKATNASWQQTHIGLSTKKSTS